jgi:iron complex transport system ATP-binding protein
VLEVRDLDVRYGDARALDAVALDVADAEIVSIVGPNGAGKSTLLRHVAGLTGGSSELAVDGRDLRALRPRERARLVALVVQAPTIPEGITVADYVLLGRHAHIRPFGVEGPSDLAAVHDALARLDLLELSGRVVATLSGGERQRVLLARALAQEAPVLLLDEPTTALDIGHQQQVLEAVDQLRRSAGLTVLTTMHDLTLAAQYADRLVLLDGGVVTAEGTAAEVLTPDHLSRHYGANVRIVDDGGRPAVIPVREIPHAHRP